MKRSREEIDEVAKPVAIIVMYEDLDLTYTTVAYLTPEEFDALVPEFIGSGPIDRAKEITDNGPAASALKHIFKYSKDQDDDDWYEDGVRNNMTREEVAKVKSYPIILNGSQ